MPLCCFTLGKRGVIVWLILHPQAELGKANPGHIAGWWVPVACEVLYELLRVLLHRAGSTAWGHGAQGHEYGLGA